MATKTTRSYFLPLVILPTVVTGSGTYITRGGQAVTVAAASQRHDFGCVGHYENGVKEGWHKSGRVLASRESANDIVSAL